MNEKKILSLLGIAKKAGKTVIGTDMTVQSIRKRSDSVKLILAASDSSKNTVKRISNTAQYYEVDLITLMADRIALGQLLGHSAEVSVVGITDIGFADAMKKAAEKEINGADQVK